MSRTANETTAWCLRHQTAGVNTPTLSKGVDMSTDTIPSARSEFDRTTEAHSLLTAPERVAYRDALMADDMAALRSIPVLACGVEWCVGESCQVWARVNDAGDDGKETYVERVHSVAWLYEGEPVVSVQASEFAHADGSRQMDRVTLDVESWTEDIDLAEVMAGALPAAVALMRRAVAQHSSARTEPDPVLGAAVARSLAATNRLGAFERMGR